MERVKVFCLWAVFLVTGLLMTGCESNSADKDSMVFVMTNDAASNKVVAFHRAADGTLCLPVSYTTGGKGTGTTEVTTVTKQDGMNPLASQGALVLSPDGTFLFAVNAGSDTISSFRVSNSGVLILADTKPSGGKKPNSLSCNGSLLYVSNVGDTTNGFHSNVTGFRLQRNGKLTPIQCSTQALSVVDAQPACVQFSPDGDLLAVSELSKDRISLFTVDEDGTLSQLMANISSGPLPFGLAFLSRDKLLVTEASGGLSSYDLHTNGMLIAISPSVQTCQRVTSQVAVTPLKRWAFTSNTGSNTITSCHIAGDGALTINVKVAGTLEGEVCAPTDSGISGDGRYLYVLNDGLGAVSVLRIENDGNLTPVQTITGQGLPARGAQGLAVR